MVCNTSCVIAIGLIVAMLFTMISPNKFSLMSKYELLLSKIQLEKYYKIRKERLMICIMGFVLGIIIAFGVVMYMKKSVLTNVCLVGAIVFIVNYFFYIFYPKSSYMITELDEKEDREAWLAIYKHMTYIYHLGFVLGVLGAMVLCYGIFKK
jgi:hypothetical protein